MILQLRQGHAIETEEEIDENPPIPIVIASSFPSFSYFMTTVAILDEQDENERIAVKALGSMRNSTSGLRILPPLSTPAPPSPTYQTVSLPRSPTSTNPSLSVPSTSAPRPPTSGLTSRMSQLPIVESALWAYEQGKASSRVVKYGAEMVESSMKSMSRPIMDRLPVNQLDEYAGRQFDRLERYRRPSNTEPERPEFVSSPERGRPRLKSKTFDGTAQEQEDWTHERDASMHRARSNSRSADHVGPNVNRWIQATTPYISASTPPPPLDSRSVTPVQKMDHHDGPRNEAERTRWQTVLSEAGGIGAALSEDNMKKIKYCLEWLQYATARIDAQILILRDFTSAFQPQPSESLAANRRPPISEEHMKRLSDVRRDIIGTIRQVVDIVSKHAGTSLPEPARDKVRSFILTLPQRWATKAGPAVTNPAPAVPVDWCPPDREKDRERDRDRDRGETVAAAGNGSGASARRAGAQRRAAAQRERGSGTGGGPSNPPSRASSPATSPRINRASVAPATSGLPSHHTASTAAQRILTLATESLDMMRNVTLVMKDSLDKAEAWVGRLRLVGIQRDGPESESSGPPIDDRPQSTAPDQPRLPPLSLLTSTTPSLRHRHPQSNHDRRREAVSRDNADADDEDEEYLADSPVYPSTSTDFGASSSSRWNRSSNNLTSVSSSSLPHTSNSHSSYPYHSSDPKGYPDQYSSQPYPSSRFSSSRRPSPPPLLHPPQPPTHLQLPPMLPNFDGMSSRKMDVSQIVESRGAGARGTIKREDDIDERWERERERFPRYDQSQAHDSRNWESEKDRKERERQARLERDLASREQFLNEYQSTRRDVYSRGVSEDEDDGDESEEEGRRMDTEY